MLKQSDDLKPSPEPVSTNPTSRPKHTTLSDAARYLLGQPVPGDKFGRTYAGVIANAVVARACQGDSRAVKEITELISSSGCINCLLNDEVRRMPTEDLEAIVRAYCVRSGIAPDGSTGVLREVKV